MTGTLVVGEVGIATGLLLTITPGAGVGVGVEVGAGVGVGDAVGWLVGPGGVRKPGGVVTLPAAPQAATQAAASMPMPRRTDTPEGIKRTGGPLWKAKKRALLLEDVSPSGSRGTVVFLFERRSRALVSVKIEKARGRRLSAPASLSGLTGCCEDQQQLPLDVAEK